MPRRLALHICCSFSPASPAPVKAHCCLATTTPRFCGGAGSFAGEQLACMSCSAERSSSFHPKPQPAQAPWGPAQMDSCCPWVVGSVSVGCLQFGLSRGQWSPPSQGAGAAFHLVKRQYSAYYVLLGSFCLTHLEQHVTPLWIGLNQYK